MSDRACRDLRPLVSASVAQVDVQATALKVRVKGELFFGGKLFGPVEADETMWTLGPLRQSCVSGSISLDQWLRRGLLARKGVGPSMHLHRTRRTLSDPAASPAPPTFPAGISVREVFS